MVLDFGLWFGSVPALNSFSVVSAYRFAIAFWLGSFEMRDNTPPHSPYVLEGAAEEDEDELVYVGDADEVLDAWENEANGT